MPGKQSENREIGQLRINFGATDSRKLPSGPLENWKALLWASRRLENNQSELDAANVVNTMAGRLLEWAESAVQVRASVACTDNLEQAREKAKEHATKLSEAIADLCIAIRLLGVAYVAAERAAPNNVARANQTLKERCDELNSKIPPIRELIPGIDQWIRHPAQTGPGVWTTKLSQDLDTLHAIVGLSDGHFTDQDMRQQADSLLQSLHERQHFLRNVDLSSVTPDQWNQPADPTVTAGDSSLLAETTTTMDRRFMELAIEEARKSVVEDNRAHPKVGAVVVKSGTVVATAFRGELGKGEHAEYTALEKKLPDETLAGATVYATLEPCTTRNHPKIPCAQRLIDRRVKRVVIGMLDPNPRICGKGERLLREHGIEVERFPHELVMRLEEINRDFVRTQRQADVQPPKPSMQDTADQISNLSDLQRRFVDAQDRFPRDVSFALVMIPHDERSAWDEAKRRFDDPIRPPQKYGWKCLRWAYGADTAETITITASERTDGEKVPELYPLETWKCWLFRQSTTAEYPSNALNMFLSLANDACRALDLRDCGQIINGRRIAGKRAKFQHLLRWAIEQLPVDECTKLTWLDPPNEHVHTTLWPGHTPRRWAVEMPCVFAAVAEALERHMHGLGKSWPSA